jgi:hypothetical protein
LLVLAQFGIELDLGVKLGEARITIFLADLLRLT